MSDSNSNEIAQKEFSTKCIQAGQDFNQWSNLEIIPPIVTSNTFYQEDPTNLKGFSYCRAGNPTRSSLERCLAELDNGEFCLTFPSGCAATTDVMQLLKAGDHVIVSLGAYGGTRTLFLHYISMHDIEIDFIDTTDSLSVKNAIKSNTKVILVNIVLHSALKHNNGHLKLILFSHHS